MEENRQIDNLEASEIILSLRRLSDRIIKSGVLDIDVNNSSTEDKEKVAVYLLQAHSLILSAITLLQDSHHMMRAIGQYIRQFKEDELEKEVARLTEEVERLQKERDEEIRKRSIIQGRYKELEERLNGQLWIIEEEIKSYSAFKTRQGRLQKGDKIRKKKEIEDDELVRMYKENGNKITQEMLKYFQAKTPITYQGLRVRLQALGVWEFKK